MLTFIAGPCTIESPAIASALAAELKSITSRFPVDFIFKASFDKANRTKQDSFRGLGKDYAIEILRSIRSEVKVKVTTDIHHPEDVQKIIDFVDVIQIPAMLSRQTDLIIAAAESRKAINVKKMQMMSPDDIKYVIEKIRSKSNAKIYITERGTCFGYNNLIVDFRGFHTMSQYDAEILFDASHSLQRPSTHGNSGSTPDARDIAPKMARAAVAMGVGGIFVECANNPTKVRCDGDTSLYLSQIEPLLKDLTNIPPWGKV